MTKHIDNYDQLMQTRLRTLENMEAYRILNELIPYELAFTNDPNAHIGEELIDNHSRFTNIDTRFNSILGIVPTQNALMLQKLVFRMSKENIFIRSKNLNEISDDYVSRLSVTRPKTLMYILFPKGELNLVYQSISKVLGTFEFIKLDVPYT